MIADLILISCIVLIAIGTGLIFLPAGLIAAGALGGAATLLYARTEPPAPEEGLTRDR